MKKIAIIPLTFFLVTGLQAQVGKLVGGINFSKYHSIDWAGQQRYKTGYWGGIGFEWGTGNIVTELDFLYLQKGSKRELSPTSTIKYYLHEISAPLMVKIKLLPKTTPYLLGGVELAFVFSYQRESNGTKTRIDDSIKKVDYGLLFGGGLELWLGSLALILEGRYHYGLANLNRGGTFDFKSSSILILLGFKF